MEYVVGSLTDLISESNVPKRKKSGFSKGSAVKIKYEKVEVATHKTETDINGDETFALKQKKGKALHKIKISKSPLRVEHNAEKRIKFKQKPAKQKHMLDEEKESRTVFVKNVPNNLKKSNLKSLFAKYGEIQSVRLRCAPLLDPRVPKKVAIIKGKFHPERSNISAFVCFTSVDSANSALAASGSLIADHHILVDKALKTNKYDPRKAIFIGNCPFAAEEDDLWKMFENCGKILDIRIIRDRNTGIGKGFAYINFESADAVELALSFDGEKLKDRELRVSRTSKKKKTSNQKAVQRSFNFTTSSKQNQRPLKRKYEPGPEKNYEKKRRMNDGRVTEKAENYQQPIAKVKKIKKKKLNDSNNSGGITKKTDLFSNDSTFQGQKTSKKSKLKKKKKINKGELKKKIMIKKLAIGTETHSRKVKFNKKL